ncbi:hypothetical protein HN51_012135 [Arachis hypogaea]
MLSMQLLIGIRKHVQINLVLDLFLRLMLRGVDDEKEYHVKWKELPYDECYWEFETDISTFQPEIKRFNKFRSRSSKLASMKQRSSVKDDVELKNYNM